MNYYPFLHLNFFSYTKNTFKFNQIMIAEKIKEIMVEKLYIFSFFISSEEILCKRKILMLIERMYVTCC